MEHEGEAKETFSFPNHDPVGCKDNRMARWHLQRLKCSVFGGQFDQGTRTQCNSAFIYTCLELSAALGGVGLGG